MTKIDLNCDLGESFGPWEMGNDAAMIELATSVNVACGFHAGDPDIMRKTVELAKARGVGVGAHPDIVTSTALAAYHTAIQRAFS